MNAPTLPTTTRPACPAHMRHLTLGDVEIHYREGRFPMSDLVAYLRAWNATPGRFTQAFWRGNDVHGRIVQIDPEELKPAARDLFANEAATCGANLGAPAPVPAPQAVELKTVNASGAHDARQDRHYANGKRITREQFDAIRRASVRLTEESGAQSYGVWTFYRTAYVPADRWDVLACLA